jgi:hypothetical protein
LTEQEWPHRVRLKAGDTEDSVFGDLDGDGAFEVVTANETTHELFIHWAPQTPTSYLDARLWTRSRLDESARLWREAAVAQLDGELGLDVIGGIESRETLGQTLYWYRAPSDPRNMAWQEYLISDETYTILSIEPIDMDGDGDLDIVTGARFIVAWLENPSPEFNPRKPWDLRKVEFIGCEASFLALEDIDRDNRIDIVATDYRYPATAQVATWYRNEGYGPTFSSHTICVRGGRPFSGYKNGTKGVVCGDVNQDGKADLVFTTHVGNGSRVFWLEHSGSPTDIWWQLHDIRAMEDATEEKYDDVQLVDLDRDGDLDVLTSEENRQLGVVWFGNPYTD